MSKIPRYKPPSEKSVADVEGPWQDPGVETGLIARCRENWNTPSRNVAGSLREPSQPC